MNRNEFYKQLMSEYSFDADKIRENAKRGKSARQKLQPMYIGMTAAAVLPGVLAQQSGGLWFWSAAAVLALALVVTVLGNVPINLRTLRISGRRPPNGFVPMRRRWDVYQAVRGSLQLLGFVLVCLGIAFR